MGKPRRRSVDPCDNVLDCKHLFIGIAENKVGVDADLAPGKSYYVITEPRMGGWKARLAPEDGR